MELSCCSVFNPYGWPAEEAIRSAQLYASNPADMQLAASMLVQDLGAEHVDINFGCPVRKITSRGGGAAIPLKLALFRDLVKAAVEGASGAPVTVKMRVGISQELVRPRWLNLPSLCCCRRLSRHLFAKRSICFDFCAFGTGASRFRAGVVS
jgi:tRNA-dihydrouridine synthase